MGQHQQTNRQQRIITGQQHQIQTTRIQGAPGIYLIHTTYPKEIFYFGILHHLSVITIIHFTEIQARLSESKQTSLEAMFSRRIDKISLTDSSLMKKLKLRQQKGNKMKTPGHQPHLGWKIQP